MWRVTFLVAVIGGLVVCMSCFSLKAQSTTVRASLFEGVVAVGYIDRGATVNFTGPAIKVTHRPFSFLAGMLPSLKIKKDNAPANATRNASVIPSLGFGATLIYKHIALQVPFLYNPKTATANGKWNAGIGLGYKF
ncbi:hypothetical protein [Pedobacter faecalis]|uniref:hypothetical protein n=1 Tax=Pedobacter faecalis TaxID=3041495 RepID=UPI00254A1A45|nr:hypothetical protein [Pedobacter sp. ELA7]